MAGTLFVLPPSHRLFVVFEAAEDGLEALQDAGAAGLTDTTDAWIFSGEEGVTAVDPGIARHGIVVGLVRVLQRMMTSDCEYCDGLARALRAGAVVMALKVEEERVEQTSEVLRRHGGHSMAYGSHWNFVALPHASHTAGSTEFVRDVKASA